MAQSHSWSRVPKPEDRVHRETVQVTRDARSWSGSWTIENGDIFVVSAYGSRRARVNRHKLIAAQAEALMGEIIDARTCASPKGDWDQVGPSRQIS
jgi:hypothetical protein